MGQEEVSAGQQARRERVRAGWQPPPGPLPVGPGEDPALRPGPGESLDMLSGEFRLFQRRDGHRYSTDDLLAAWYACRVAEDCGVEVRRYVDLGSGIGSIAMMVAWKLPRARGVAIEAQALSADLMARSLRYNGLVERVEQRRGDLRDAALLPEGRVFDLATGSPPYFLEGKAVESGLPQRAPCRFEHRGGVEGYVEAMGRALAPHGVGVLVHLLEVEARVREEAQRHGLELFRLRPVVFSEGREPYLGLYALRWAPQGARRETQVEEPLLIRTAARQRSPEYQQARLWMGFPP